jgi:acyl carrier protein
MDQSQVIQELQKVFDQTFVEDVVVTPQLSADDVEEWDSLTHVSLILAIEKAFNLRFRVGEVEATKNVGDLANLIAKKLDKR